MTDSERSRPKACVKCDKKPIASEIPTWCLNYWPILVFLYLTFFQILSFGISHMLITYNIIPETSNNIKSFCGLLLAIVLPLSPLMP